MEQLDGNVTSVDSWNNLRPINNRKTTTLSYIYGNRITKAVA